MADGVTSFDTNRVFESERESYFASPTGLRIYKRFLLLRVISTVLWLLLFALITVVIYCIVNFSTDYLMTILKYLLISIGVYFALCIVYLVFNLNNFRDMSYANLSLKTSYYNYKKSVGLGWIIHFDRPADSPYLNARGGGGSGNGNEALDVFYGSVALVEGINEELGNIVSYSSPMEFGRKLIKYYKSFCIAMIVDIFLLFIDALCVFLVQDASGKTTFSIIGYVLIGVVTAILVIYTLCEFVYFVGALNIFKNSKKESERNQL